MRAHRMRNGAWFSSHYAAGRRRIHTLNKLGVCTQGGIWCERTLRRYTSYRERKCAENYNKQHNKFIFTVCNQHFGNFKP